MPDLDVLAAGIGPAWATPYRLLAGAGSPDDIARAVVRSLASNLRRFGGFPEARAMGCIVDEVASGRLAPSQALARVREVALQAGNELHVNMAARSAERLVVEVARGQRTWTRSDAAVTAYACAALVDNRLFDRARLRLVGERFASYDDAIAYELTIRAALAPQLAKVAAELVHDQTGAGVRAPRRPPGARASTADQLFEPIPIKI